MKFLIWFFFLHLRIIYFFMKFNKTKNKVTFISRLSNEPSIDFEMLIKELTKDDNIKIVFLCKKMNNYISYYFHFYKQMYEISTSKVCVIDSYIPIISMLNHKKELKVLQLWHSLGAIKKFGLQNLKLDSGRNEKISNAMNMHKKYTNIITTSDETTKYFKKAFGYEKETFLNYGLPRIDYLLKEKNKIKKQIYKKYPSLKNKETIIYAPTFRRREYSDRTEDIIDIIDFNKYNLIIKSHPLQKINIKNDDIYTCKEFSSMQLLTVSDIVITDYSAISLEAYVLDKKVLYYLYDLNEYGTKTGLNVDLTKELFNNTFLSKKQLKTGLVKYDLNQAKAYKEKYIDNLKGNSTKLIVDKIKGWMN